LLVGVVTQAYDLLLPAGWRIQNVGPRQTFPRRFYIRGESMLLKALRSLFRSKRAKMARRKSFVPQVDVLEDRRLLASVTRLVDDSYTPAQLNATHFNSIQLAVNAANPGDTVKVLPGYYHESVVVGKKLLITGAFAPSNPTAPSGDPALNVTKASIVDGLGAGTTFTLNANDIVLQGFTIANIDGDIDSVGVFTDPTRTGDKVIANVIQGNTTGIYLNSSTANNNNGAAKLTLVSGNVLLNNNAAGAAAGNAIYSDQGLRNATIAGNRISQHDNASIILVGGPLAATSQTKLTIAGNVIGKFTAHGTTPTAAQTGASMIIANTSDSLISGNVSYNSIGTGIFLAGGNTRDRIVGNYLTGGAFTGINVRFDDSNYPVTVVNTRIDVIANTVTYFGDSGIRLRDGTSNLLVRGNVLLNNGTGGFPETGDGISVEGSFNNNIDGNVAKYNGRNGIAVDVDSSNNTIQNNVAVRNNARNAAPDPVFGGYDYFDASIGGGTAGTANTYKKNSGRTESPVGLIKFKI
jgi:parallel beta-helix repeat protein